MYVFGKGSKDWTKRLSHWWRGPKWCHKKKLKKKSVQPPKQPGRGLEEWVNHIHLQPYCAATATPPHPPSITLHSILQFPPHIRSGPLWERQAVSIMVGNRFENSRFVLRARSSAAKREPLEFVSAATVFIFTHLELKDGPINVRQGLRYRSTRRKCTFSSCPVFKADKYSAVQTLERVSCAFCLKHTDLTLIHPTLLSEHPGVAGNTARPP